jgi:hypothetical protein
LKQADLSRKRVQKQQYHQESSEDENKSQSEEKLLPPRSAKPGHLGNNNQETIKQRKIDEKMLFGDCKEEEKKTEVNLSKEKKRQMKA